MNDITKDEQVKFASEEAMLRDSIQRYQAMIDLTPICIKVFDSAGKLVYLNKGGRDEHHIKDTDDIGKWDWVGTVVERDRPVIMEAFQNGLKGVATRVEMEHTPEGASHKYCEGVISPIKDERGNVSMLLFYSLDATEKRLAEAEVERQEKDLQVRNKELDKMNKFMVGRELRMVELKERIKELEKSSGHQEAD